MTILEGENASMKRDQEKLEADNSVLQAEKATLEADIRALVEYKQVHPVTNQDHGRTAILDYGPPSSYTTRKSNPRHPPTAFAAPPEWRNRGRRGSTPAPTPETPSRPPSAVSQATSHTLVNNSRAPSVEKSSERGKIHYSRVSRPRSRNSRSEDQRGPTPDEHRSRGNDGPQLGISSSQYRHRRDERPEDGYYYARSSSRHSSKERHSDWSTPRQFAEIADEFSEMFSRQPVRKTYTISGRTS